MNRKQRRIAQSQGNHKTVIRLRGSAHTIDEANMLAMREKDRGNIQAAAEIYDLIIAKAPGHAEIYNNYGNILRELRRYDKALAAFDKAIMLRLDYADAYYNRGNSLQDMQRYDEALATYDKVIALKPDYVEAHNNRGNALRKLERYEDALVSYSKAIKINPGYADVYNNHGLILQEMRRYDNALASNAKAIALKPDFAEAHYNRGLTLQQMKRYAEALVSYDKAITLKPGYADAHNNRGVTLDEMKRYAEALASFEMAIALKPDSPYLIGNLLHTRMQLCKWQEIDHNLETLAKGIEDGKPVLDPFALMAMPLPWTQQRKCAEIYIKNKFPPRPVKLWNGERYSHAKIRIAYVSADFHEHALSILMAGVFEHHDKSRFESYGISLMPEAKDPVGQRVKAAFDQFIDVSQKSDHEVARILRDLEIDIAVDLMGFTLNCRTNIFAYRPAPVQVNYLGYPGTMGADYMDYIIADAFVVPPQSLAQYAEKVVYLPGCFQANDDKRFVNAEKPSRATCGLPEEGFVFCSFNNSCKINPALFDVWMRLLKAVPGSVLWLLGNDAVQSNLNAEADNRGVDSSRLIFAARAKYNEHLARLQNADLYLDTLPFNAGATASDVLWAGVPLLTCAGEAFAARMAGSLLTTMELPELITGNLNDYETRALALAVNPERLGALRQKLAQNRITSPLFNTALFTKYLEDAYVKMRERSHAELLSDHIYVQA